MGATEMGYGTKMYLEEGFDHFRRLDIKRHAGKRVNHAVTELDWVTQNNDVTS